MLTTLFCSLVKLWKNQYKALTVIVRVEYVHIFKQKITVNQNIILICGQSLTLPVQTVYWLWGIRHSPFSWGRWVNLLDVFTAFLEFHNINIFIYLFTFITESKAMAHFVEVLTMWMFSQTYHFFPKKIIHIIEENGSKERIILFISSTD